jgi:hypothetical protein
MAVMAPTASATDTIQVVNEDTGTTCGSPVAAGCVVHMSGGMDMRIDLGIFGELNELSCNLELAMKSSGAGNLSVLSVSTTPGDSNCATLIAKCNLPWLGYGEEDGPSGVVQGAVMVCIDPAETDVTNCQGAFAITLTEGANESLVLQPTTPYAPAGLCEIDLLAFMEHAEASNAEIHINHP